MYAIFETGGKQYKVEQGSVIFVEKLDAEEGATVTAKVLKLILLQTGNIHSLLKLKVLLMLKENYLRMFENTLTCVPMSLAKELYSIWET